MEKTHFDAQTGFRLNPNRLIKTIVFSVGVIAFLLACSLPNNLNPLGPIIDAAGGNSGPTATPTNIGGIPSYGDQLRATQTAVARQTATH